MNAILTIRNDLYKVTNGASRVCILKASFMRLPSLDIP